VLESDWVLGNEFNWRGALVRWDRTGTGAPVVLCHGTPWSSYVWRAAVENLSSERTVYVWDMIGYGQSDKPDADVSLGEQGGLLAALLDHWDLEAPDIVAHDYGGAVTLRAHLLHGVSVRSLALVDVVALSPWGSPFFRLVGQHPKVFTQLPPNLHQALVREYIAGASHQGLSRDVHDALVSPWLGTEGQPAFYRQIAQADQGFTDEIEPRYPQISVPTLIVWGTADEWLPVDHARQLHHLIPGSRIELIDGAGHLVQEDRPTELNLVLYRWLIERLGERIAASR
jgi:pimeloyl-ACP methyl ester carboxylesterase